MSDANGINDLIEKSLISSNTDVNDPSINKKIDQALEVSPDMGLTSYEAFDNSLMAYRAAVMSGDPSRMTSFQMRQISDILGKDVTSKGSELWNALVRKFETDYAGKSEEEKNAGREKTTSDWFELFGNNWNFNDQSRMMDMVRQNPNLTDEQRYAYYQKYKEAADKPLSGNAQAVMGDLISRIAPLPGVEEWRLGPDRFINAQLRANGFEGGYSGSLPKDIASTIMAIPASVIEMTAPLASGILNSGVNSLDTALVGGAYGATIGAASSVATAGLASPITVSVGYLGGLASGALAGMAWDGGKIASGQAYAATLEATMKKVMVDDPVRGPYEKVVLDHQSASIAGFTTKLVTASVFGVLSAFTAAPVGSLAGKAASKIASETAASLVMSETQGGSRLLSTFSKEMKGLFNAKNLEGYATKLAVAAPTSMAMGALITAVGTNLGLKISQYAPEDQKEYRDWVGETVKGFISGLAVSFGLKLPSILRGTSKIAFNAVVKEARKISDEVTKRKIQKDAAEIERASPINVAEEISTQPISKPVESAVFHGDLSEQVVTASENRASAEAKSRSKKSSPISEGELVRKLSSKLSKEAMDYAMADIQKKKAGEVPTGEDVPQHVKDEIEARNPNMSYDDVLSAIDSTDFGLDEAPFVDPEVLRKFGMNGGKSRMAAFQVKKDANVLQLDNAPKASQIEQAVKDGVDVITWADEDGRNIQILNKDAVIKVADDGAKKTRSRKKAEEPIPEQDVPTEGHPLFAGKPGKIKADDLTISKNFLEFTRSLGIPDHEAENIPRMFSIALDKARTTFGRVLDESGLATFERGSEKDPMGFYIPNPSGKMFKKFSDINDRVNHVIAIAKDSNWKNNYRTLVHELVHMTMNVLSKNEKVIKVMEEYLGGEEGPVPFSKWTDQMQEMFPDQFEMAVNDGIFERLKSFSVSDRPEVVTAFKAFAGVLRDIVQFVKDMFTNMMGKKILRDETIVSWLDDVFLKAEHNDWGKKISDYEAKMIKDRYFEENADKVRVNYVSTKHLRMVDEDWAKNEIKSRKKISELIGDSYVKLLNIVSDGKMEAAVVSLKDELGVNEETAKVIYYTLTEDGTDNSLSAFKDSIRSAKNDFENLRKVLDDVKKFSPDLYSSIIGKKKMTSGELPLAVLERTAQMMSNTNKVRILRDMWFDSISAKVEDNTILYGLRDKIDSDAKFSEEIYLHSEKTAPDRIPNLPEELDLPQAATISDVSKKVADLEKDTTRSYASFSSIREAARDYAEVFLAKVKQSAAKSHGIKDMDRTSMLVVDGLSHIARFALGMRRIGNEAIDAKLTLDRLGRIITAAEKKYEKEVALIKQFLPSVKEIVDNEKPVEQWKRSHAEDLNKLIDAVGDLGKKIRDDAWYNRVGRKVQEASFLIMKNQLEQSATAQDKALFEHLQKKEAEFGLNAIAIENGVTSQTVELIGLKYREETGKSLRAFVKSEVAKIKEDLNSGKAPEGMRWMTKEELDALISKQSEITQNVIKNEGVRGTAQDFREQKKVRPIFNITKNFMESNAILNDLDGASKGLADFDGPILTTFRDIIHNARDLSSKESYALFDDFKKFIESDGSSFERELGKLGESVDIPALVRMRAGKKGRMTAKLTRHEMIGVYVASKNQQSVEHLVYGNKFSEDVIANIIGYLSEKEKAIGDWIVSNSERNKVKDFENEAILTGKYVRSIEGDYTHIVVNKEGESGLTSDTPITASGELLRSQQNKDALKSRMQLGKRASPISLNVISDFFAAQDDRAFRIHGGEGLAVLKELLVGNESSGWREVFKANHGEKLLKTLESKVVEQLKGKLWENQILGESSRSNNFLIRVMGRMSIAQFAFRAVSAAAQIFGATITPYFARNPFMATLETLKYITPGMKSMKGLKGFMDEDGKPLSVDEFIRKSSGFMRARSFSKNVHHLDRLIATGKIDRFMKDSTRYGMYMMQKADEHAANTTWIAIYMDETRHLSKTNMSKEEIHAKAVSKADFAVERSQPNGDLWSTPDAFKSNNAAIRMFLMFSQSLMKLGAIMYKDTITNFSKVLSPAAKGMRAKLLGRAMSLASIAFVSSVIQSATYFSIRNGAPDDEKDLIQVGKDALLSPLGPFGMLAITIFDSFTSKSFTGRTRSVRIAPAPISALEEVVKGLPDFTNGQSLDKLIHVGTTAAKFFGMPGSMMESIYRSGKAYVDDKYLTTVLNLAGANVNPDTRRE